MPRPHQWPSLFYIYFHCLRFITHPIQGIYIIYYLSKSFWLTSESNMRLFMYRVYPITDERSSCRTQRSATLLFSFAVKSFLSFFCIIEEDKYTCRKNHQAKSLKKAIKSVDTIRKSAIRDCNKKFIGNEKC